MSKLQDLTGLRFGRLVVKCIDRNKKKPTRWICKCDCGNEISVMGQSLKNGHTKSCGCIIFKDLTGKKFGRLTVVNRADSRIDPSGKPVTMWNVQCDCGKKLCVEGASLRSGNTQSCGCLNREIVKLANTKHGKSYNRLYWVWNGIKNRCYNKNCSGYKNYGARGIRMCDEWKNNFQIFYDWAHDNGYDENAPKGQCTIDRIDVNGNYEPSNCHWVDITYQQQSEHKRIRNPIVINGVAHSLKDWCRIYGINYATVQCRVYDNGWDKVKAITTPLLKNRNKH